MGDPIQNLRAIVEGGRRLHQTHRNEWPDLWEAIDKLVGLSDTAYMFTADQYESDDEPDRDGPLLWCKDWSSPSEPDKPEPKLDSDEVTPMTIEDLRLTIDQVTVEADQWPYPWPQAEKIFVEVTHEGGRSEIMEVMRGQLWEDWSSPEDEIYDLPIDIETIALGDAEHWAMWFKAWLEENPDVDIDEITPWFARALAVGEVNQHPLIEVTMNADGDVVSHEAIR